MDLRSLCLYSVVIGMYRTCYGLNSCPVNSAKYLEIRCFRIRQKAMIANVSCLNTASNKTGKKLPDITSKNCSVPFLTKITQISSYIYDPFPTSIKISCAPPSGKNWIDRWGRARSGENKNYHITVAHDGERRKYRSLAQTQQKRAQTKPKAHSK
jgi:hypothetical protein